MVSLGLIGLGNIGKLHADYLRAGEIDGCKLVAVADKSEDLLAQYRDTGSECFSDSEELLAMDDLDAVLIATPSFLHYPLGEAALKKGLHVLMEKPLATHKADAERLLDLCAGEQVFALMMNLRADPIFARMKTIMSEQSLGELRRVSWTMTDWFRPEVYFASSDWRATWRGEGGGVLMNQCPHNLDIMQWLCGMPAKMYAQCAFGKHHDIEVEDEVVAQFSFENGAVGSFVASTGEAPGVNRLEIACDRGLMILENGELHLTQYDVSVSEFSRETDEMFGTPEATPKIFKRTDEKQVNPHAVITQNFVDAILRGEDLISPASDGVGSLELAGAMLYSSWKGEQVDIPLDSAGYESELSRRVAESKPRKVTRQAAKVDMSKSFSK